MKRSAIEGFDMDALIAKLKAEGLKTGNDDDLKSIMIPLMMETPQMRVAKGAGSKSLLDQAGDDLVDRMKKLR